MKVGVFFRELAREHLLIGTFLFLGIAFLLLYPPCVCACMMCVCVQLQLENEQLYDELNSMVDEVR